MGLIDYLTFNLLNGIPEEELEITLMADNGYSLNETEEVLKEVKQKALAIANRC